MITLSRHRLTTNSFRFQVMTNPIIATHNGTFQADEALGVWLLRQIPAYGSAAQVIRSRDPAIFSKADIVLDVGGVYDHSLKRYDHHQRDYNERFDAKKPNNEERCTKLSASGLIYRHYGREVIKSFYPSISNECLESAYVRLYDRFMESIDAVDTGVEPYPDAPLYRDNSTLSRRIARKNRRWNEPLQSVGITDEEDSNLRFDKASNMAGAEFQEMLSVIIESEIPAEYAVKDAIQKRFDVCASGEIIRLVEGGLPWQSCLFEIEREEGLSDDETLSSKGRCIKFVLYEDQGGMWRVQAVTVKGKSFVNRVSLPEEWRGLRDNDLVATSQIPSSRFVHASGFIGGNDSYFGALEMARVALIKSRQ